MVEHRCEQLWPFEHKEEQALALNMPSPLPNLLARSPGPFFPSAPPSPLHNPEQTTGLRAGHHLVFPARSEGYRQGVAGWPGWATETL